MGTKALHYLVKTVQEESSKREYGSWTEGAALQDSSAMDVPPRATRPRSEEQAVRARKFLELHQGPKTLVLPNAWDVASARVFEEAGFPVVATTSAGIAFALGYPDGERLLLPKSKPPLSAGRRLEMRRKDSKRGNAVTSAAPRPLFGRLRAGSRS
jgi:hypothetical protein